jgi:hypothetical protein
VIWLIWLENMRLGKHQRWYLFPLSMLLWANLHGAFIAGLLLWGCYFFGLLIARQPTWTQLKPYFWAGGSSLGVTLLNPDGFGIWKTGLGFLSNKYLVSHTAEYLPPDFQASAFWPFLGLIFASLVILALSKKRIEVPHLFVIGGWTVLGLYSARNIPLYAVTAMPLLSSVCGEILLDMQYRRGIKRILTFDEGLQEIQSKIRGGVWAIASIVLVVVGFASGKNLDYKNEGNQFQEGIFPVNAVNWIEENQPSGNGFNYFPWGGYLLYRLWPDRLVFIDGQTDFYGEDLTRQYEEVITAGNDWEEILAEYKVDWILIPSGTHMEDVLLESKGWQTSYKDNTSIIFIRSVD